MFDYCHTVDEAYLQGLSNTSSTEQLSIAFRLWIASRNNSLTTSLTCKIKSTDHLQSRHPRLFVAQHPSRPVTKHEARPLGAGGGARLLAVEQQLA